MYDLPPLKRPNLTSWAVEKTVRLCDFVLHVTSSYEVVQQELIERFSKSDLNKKKSDFLIFLNHDFFQPWPVLLKLRMTEVAVTTGAMSHAKLQSNRRRQ